MRFYTVLSSRPQYYDRNPLDVVIGFQNGSTAPHTVTVRAAYTVPSARKAFMGSAFTAAIRDSAATTASTVTAYCTVTPSGGTAINVMVATHFSNAVDGGRELTMSSGMALQAGDLAQLRTSDASTGGTNYFSESFIAIEFDA